MTIRLPPALQQQFAALCRQTACSQAQLLRQLVAQAVGRHAGTSPAAGLIERQSSEPR